MARPRPSIVGHAIERDKHEKMLDDMHSALHSLGSQIREPFMEEGSKNLLPGSVKPENPKGKAARAHIEKLHGAFKEHAKEKK
jgi:hypothetical protein